MSKFDKLFTKAVEENISIAGVIKSLNRAVVGSNYRFVKQNVARLKLDTSHWKGQAHGSSNQNKKLKPEQALKKNSMHDTSVIKKVVLRNNILPLKCSVCDLEGYWMGKPIVLRLDHINGDNRDHRISNLRFLCPNCDSQTETYCGKNKKKPKVRTKWISRKSLGLSPISSKHKIEWLPLKTLLFKLKNQSFRSLARELGVSDNAIRKHIKNELKKKTRVV